MSKESEEKKADELKLELLDLGVEDVVADDIWCEDSTGKISHDTDAIKAALAVAESKKKSAKSAGAKAKKGEAGDPDADEEGDDVPDAEEEKEELRKRIVRAKRLQSFRSFGIMALVGAFALLTGGLSYVFLFKSTSAQTLSVKNQVQDVAGKKVRFTIDTSIFTVPLPEDFEYLAVEKFYRAFPLAEKAAKLDRATPVFAASAILDAGQAYFVSLAVDDAHNLVFFQKDDFADMLQTIVANKELASAAKTADILTVAPYNVTPLSFCFGRVISDGNTGSLHQYSCMLYLEGRAVVLNAGFSIPAGQAGDAAEKSEYVRILLESWRKQIMDKELG